MKNNLFAQESRSPRNNCQLSTDQLSTEFNIVKPIDNCREDLDPVNNRINQVLQQTRDLRIEKFTAWHARQVRRLGVDRYLGLASDARKGRSPARYFTFLLKHT